MAELPSFEYVRFPTAISFGATGGPEWRNEIVGLTSGREKRNARFASSRRRYDAGTGVRSLDDLHEVIAFFEARRGSLQSFRFRDPFDMKSCAPNETPSQTDQPLGVGDGTTKRFKLVKTYGEGSNAYRRTISIPAPGTLKVTRNGVAVSDYVFETNTSDIVFNAAPGNGVVVAAGFEFDVPVRFDIDHLSISLTAFKAGQIPSIPLIEVQL